MCADPMNHEENIHNQAIDVWMSLNDGTGCGVIFKQGC